MPHSHYRLGTAASIWCWLCRQTWGQDSDVSLYCWCCSFSGNAFSSGNIKFQSFWLCHSCLSYPCQCNLTVAIAPCKLMAVSATPSKRMYRQLAVWIRDPALNLTRWNLNVAWWSHADWSLTHPMVERLLRSWWTEKDRQMSRMKLSILSKRPLIKKLSELSWS